MKSSDKGWLVSAYRTIIGTTAIEITRLGNIINNVQLCRFGNSTNNEQLNIQTRKQYK